MPRSTYLTFSLFHEDAEYRVSGTYTPPDPGQTSGPPENCWPPEDDSFEIAEIIPVDSSVDVTPLQGHIAQHLDELALEKAAEVYADQKDF